MPVEDLHPQYENKQYEWRQVSDSVSGTTDIKRSGTLYLPMPNSFLNSEKILSPEGISSDHGETNLRSGTNNNFKNRSLNSIAPWNHPNPAYSAYLQRARFPNITAECKKGLVGIATKKDPKIELPPVVSYLEENCTPDGLSLVDLYEKVVGELIESGRYEILVDPTVENKTTFITYTASSFVNWKATMIDGEQVNILSVFKECVPENKDDDFSHSTIDAYNVLSIGVIDDSEGLVYLKKEFIDGVLESTVVPVLMGVSLNKIPLVVANSNGLGFEVSTSPLLGISDIAISIYQKDADMSQAEFLTCNPMLVTSGVEAVPNIVGSGVNWNLPPSEAKAYYVEPESNCLNHMESRIQSLFNEALIYGANLIGPSKKAAESFETTKIKQSAQGATLKVICNSAGEMIRKSLQLSAQWHGADQQTIDSIVFEPNIDFSEAKLSSEELKVLLQTWLNRGISQETLFFNYKESGLIPKNIDFEDELAKIDTETPSLDV